LDPLDAHWATLTIAQPEATIFHHPAWVELLKTCYGYKPMLFVILGASGQPVATLPLMQIDSWLTGRRVVSLPFSDFCPPLTIDDASLVDLVDGLQSWRRQNKVSEIQIHWPLPGMDGVYPAETVARHITHLAPDSEQVFRSFAKTQIQQRIRKAERAGVSIRMSDSWEDLRLFYGLHLETRKRLGTPIQPLRFFRLLWVRLISQGLGFVLLAYKDSQLLAGAVFLHCNKTLTYKYSASKPAYWKLHPNNLLLWHAICWGCEHGYQVFDWGKTDLGNAGLREFKLGWGSEEQILHYSVLADYPPKASAVGKAHLLLTPLIQRSPAWVCRIMGELFYRHFG
jgi:CelD/BcsL family acetyltransferase involved in cellulose biosynthesis